MDSVNSVQRGAVRRSYVSPRRCVAVASRLFKDFQFTGWTRAFLASFRTNYSLEPSAGISANLE